jgi:hypothetical protein
MSNADFETYGGGASPLGREGTDTLRQHNWTTEENELPRKLAKSDESLSEIAKHIDRSIGAIRARAKILNIALARSRPLKLFGK